MYEYEAVGVLIVDEPPGLEPNFRATLEHMPTLRTIGEEDLADETRGDGTGSPVALVFVHGPDVHATCARIGGLTDTHPALRILVAFRSLDTAAMKLLIEAGAHAFVGRSASAREVGSVILSLASGQAAQPEARDTAQSPAYELPDSSGLTPREAEVLRFLSSGFSNKEVARRLSLSVRTVETHRLNLRRKTQTGRLKDLVSLARQLGLDPVLDSEHRRTGARH